MQVPPEFFVFTGSAFERGVTYGSTFQHQILGVYQNLSNQWGHLGPIWTEVAASGLKFSKQYAPTAYAELSGMSQGSGISLEILSKILVHFELERLYNEADWDQHHGIIKPKTKNIQSKKQTISSPLSLLLRGEALKSTSPNPFGCTSFGISWEDGSCLSGQTNDEDPSLYLVDGKLADFVLKLIDSDPNIPHAIVYTHAGFPAKMGINSFGLAVMSLYIDNGEISLTAGVPFACIQRELLTKKTMEEAIEYLFSIPRCFMNCFVLSQAGKGIYTCELSPSIIRFSVTDNGETVHGNTFDLSRDFKEAKVEKKVRCLAKRILDLKSEGLNLFENDTQRRKLLIEPVANVYTIASFIFRTFSTQREQIKMDVLLAGQKEWTEFGFTE